VVLDLRFGSGSDAFHRTFCKGRHSPVSFFACAVAYVACHQETSKTFWFSSSGGVARVVHESAFRGKDRCRFAPLGDLGVGRGEGGPGERGAGAIAFADVSVRYSELSRGALDRRGGGKLKLVSISSC